MTLTFNPYLEDGAISLESIVNAWLDKELSKYVEPKLPTTELAKIITELAKKVAQEEMLRVNNHVVQPAAEHIRSIGTEGKQIFESYEHMLEHNIRLLLEHIIRPPRGD